jgi:hypothetical protein
MSQLYRHSNKFTLHGAVAGMTSGIAAAIPGAFLYVYGIWSIPEAKLRGVCPLTYGALVGASCGIAMCWGKIRNLTLAGVVGFASSLFALYLSWVIWILHLMFPSFWIFNPIRLALQPKVLWKIVMATNAEGTWSFKGSVPMTGTGLWMVWLGEAGLLLGFGVLAAIAMVKRRPFCERCEAWCSERTKLYFAPTTPPNEIKSRVLAEDIVWITKLARGDKKRAHYRLDLHTCGNCHTLNTLSLVQNLPKDRKTLVDKLILSADQTAAVLNLRMNHEMQASAPAVAVNPSIR